VGVAGSGKQTLSRFAAYVAEVAWHSIELRKGYGLAEFREDLKAAMRVSGSRTACDAATCLPLLQSACMHAL
jgi:hypothetical protein